MPNASDIADSIEPGSTEYGERDVIKTRMQQALQSATPGPDRQPGARMQRASSRLSSGPVSDKPVTAGLSVGPGAGPEQNSILQSSQAQKFKVLATQARNPMIRKMALDALRAMYMQEKRKK